MGFTSITLTGNYGTSATGTLTFTLTEAMANGDEVLTPSPQSVSLSGGAFSTTLASNNDPATTPQGVAWGVTEEVAGAQPRDFFVSLPTLLTETNGSIAQGSEYLQLSSLTGASWMVGMPVSGPGITAGTTVVYVLGQVNQLQLSAPATSTEADQSYEVGTTTVDISALMPTETGWQ